MTPTHPSHPTLSVAVLGAGAVGCFYGGMLARAGHRVTFIGRPAHVQAMAQRGLRLQTLHFDDTVPAAASTEASAVAGADVVLFAVKSPDTEAAGEQMRPHLKPDALVLCLQNGVDNAERLRAVLPGVSVAAAVVYVATEMAGPGHLRHHGRGELVIEPSPHSAELAQALIAASVPTEVSNNVRGALWAKLVLNCAYNALSAVGRIAYGELVQRPGVLAVMQDVVAECRAVATADGVTLPGDVDAAVRRIAQTMPTQYSSTAQDLMRGKPSEIDHLNGYVVRRGEALGVPTPANRVLWTVTKLVEQPPMGGRKMEPHSPFVDATPVLASLDIRRSVEFFVSNLGFKELYAVQGEYGVVQNGPTGIHFWACSDPYIPKATSCRVQVRGIEQLYQHCKSVGIVHPNAPLGSKPWGSTEFAILDPDANLVTFYEPSAGRQTHPL